MKNEDLRQLHDIRRAQQLRVWRNSAMFRAHAEKARLDDGGLPPAGGLTLGQRIELNVRLARAFNHELIKLGKQS